jgi:hypothetical protein
MTTTNIEHPNHLELDGAAPGEDAGTTEARELNAGDYEVRCTAPVRIRLGKTAAVTKADLLVLPEAPLQVRLNGTVSFAAAGPFGTSVWCTPLRRSST